MTSRERKYHCRNKRNVMRYYNPDGTTRKPLPVITWAMPSEQDGINAWLRILTIAGPEA